MSKITISDHFTVKKILLFALLMSLGLVVGAGGSAIIASYIGEGINMFSASFFTGISDGLSSALIAASRSFVMPLVLIFILPFMFGNGGIWYTTLVAEVITVILVLGHQAGILGNSIAEMKAL